MKNLQKNIGSALLIEVMHKLGHTLREVAKVGRCTKILIIFFLCRQKKVYSSEGEIKNGKLLLVVISISSLGILCF